MRERDGARPDAGRSWSLFFLSVAASLAAETAPQPPFRYVWGQAWHILPDTHSDESGYFSLCEGRDGQIYIGTAKYNLNAYLVELDPATGQQKVVIDTHRVCGLMATGYAAQSKIHTRNFVGPSGRVYVGSKQGYRREGDTLEYPGGYVMTYDPQTGQGENLGMPFPGQGVIDTVADEARGVLYAVTCEDQHWMKLDLKTRVYSELGPMLTPYASTLVDGRGRANAITRDFQLAQYDPATGDRAVRDILVDGKKFARANASSIPTWILARDGRTAYLLLMNDSTLFELDLASEGPAVIGRSLGRLIEGKNPDSRSALSLGPDGRVYAVIRVDNDTGFGGGYLHHLARYDPRAGEREDLGVLAVKNPDFFDFRPRADGKPPPWSHGYHHLPDGVLTPLYHHMALIVARDGTVYVTIICPFTLLKIPGIP